MSETKPAAPADAGPKYTNGEKLKAADREVAFRRRVYSQRVADGKMLKSSADYQIGVMEEIADDYRKLASGQKLPSGGPLI